MKTTDEQRLIFVDVLQFEIDLPEIWILVENSC